MLSAGQISITYTGLDLMGQVTFDKIVESSDEDAVQFRKDLEEVGVPLEALQNMESVIWNRASGYGSSAMRKQDLQALAPFVGSFPESGKLAYNDEVISAYVGVDKIDTFNPRSQIADEDMSVAAAENGGLVSLCEQIVSDKQDHVNHLQIHIPEIEKRVGPLRDAMEQGQTLDPQELQQTYQYLQTAGPHVEQHLAKIANDPSRAGLAKQFQAQIQEYVGFNGRLRRAIMEARREQQIAAMNKQNATAMSEMDQAKLQSQHIADQIKVDKWQTDKVIKIDKAQTSSRLSAFQTLHASTLDAAKTAVDIQISKDQAAVGAAK
jgi:hypothetical protein